MEEEYLQNFECFKNNKKSCIKIDNNTPVYYIKTKSDIDYIAWENIELVSTLIKDNITYIETVKNYYDIVSGNLIFQIVNITDMEGNVISIDEPLIKESNLIIDGSVNDDNDYTHIIDNENIKHILHMGKLLNLKGNNYTILNYDDICNITNFVEVEPKGKGYSYF